jgi:CheY-like chemotaxis protein
VKKILVVDDEAAIAEVLSELLEMAGYQVMVALNGDDALAVVGRDRPDLILTDVMMAGMDGPTLCCKLGENPSDRQIPVLFMSAVRRVSAVNGCNMVGFIAKPFDIDLLLETIARVLEKPSPPKGKATR